MQSDKDDYIKFAPARQDDEDSAATEEFWNILIADDAEEIHYSTKFALRNTMICGRKLKFFDSYTAEQTKNFILENQNIHILLLDAVMEHDRAGIECAEFIRAELKRKLPIIVMRTGFAGWEIECDPTNLTFIDDFILKSNTSRNSLISIIERWLTNVSQN